MIKTKRIYDPKEDSDGTRILITRKWPRGQKKDRFDEWIKDLSPEENTPINGRIVKGLRKIGKDTV